MIRKLVLGILLACLMVTSVQAGLQSALTEALVGHEHEAGPVLSIPLGIERVRSPGPLVVFSGVLTPAISAISAPLPPIPAGALFIDPIASTRGEGVFREGPDFHYDSTTGGVTVFAPPMLGPADEFGVRREYSPTSVRVVGRDFFAAAPTIPQLTRYVRGTPDFSLYGWYPLSLDDGNPPFVIDEQSDDFSLLHSFEAILVQVSSGRRIFSGAEVDFASLLAPELEASFFAADEGSVLPNSIWPYLPEVEGALPGIHFVVDYYNSNFLNVGVGSPRGYSLLAVPQAGLFSNATVPEPSSILLAVFPLIALLTLRRGSPLRCS